MKKHLLYWLAAVSIISFSCQKELSFEGSNTPAEGSLQADISGDCLPKTVNGTYEATVALVPATNTITVQVNVTKTGTFDIRTDTTNGFFFRGTGSFTTLGANTVTLRGYGTPFTAIITNFVVSFDSTFCDLQVTVLPAGAGGPSTFTLVNGGTPPNCASADVQGTYVQNIAVGASNYVDVTVNVTVIGTYTIRATGGGMTFQKSGGFLTTGNQTVRLLASGTPTTTGANTITFDAPFASCNFTVTVIGQAVFSADCTSAVVNGTYQAGVALNPAVHFVDIDLNVTTAGGYNISITVNGITFSGSGVLATGLQSITLTGTGTPTNSGTFPFPMPGTPSCSFDVVCNPAPVINWKFNIGTTVYQGSSSTVPGEVDYDNTTAPPFTLFTYIGYNAALDECDFDFIDLTGGINANETYNTKSQGLTNIADFYFYDIGGTIDLAADPFDTSVGIIFTVQTHSTATKTITGIFSGTAFDSISGTVKTITNGTFSITYP